MSDSSKLIANVFLRALVWRYTQASKHVRDWNNYYRDTIEARVQFEETGSSVPGLKAILEIRKTSASKTCLGDGQGGWRRYVAVGLAARRQNG